MKREIKFRGKRLDNRWLFGDLIQSEDILIMPDYAPDSYDNYIVDPATVGQYTGLKDKNGVEIYEGDILLFSEEIKCVVEFRHGMFGYEFCRNFIGFGGNYHFEFNPSDKDNRHEVIGNIHDNPELLEEKK